MRRRVGASCLVGAALLAVPALADDGLPMGTISFFNLSNCPAGWATLGLTTGRMLLGVTPTAGVGNVVGSALGSSADPIHAHTFSSSIAVNGAEYVLIGGCCNESLGAAGGTGFSGTSQTASTGLPYVQLLVCTKSAPPPANAAPVSQGALMYFWSVGCPAGWSEAITVEGRFLVGLPAGGLPGASFGGAALEPVEQRTHVHTFSGNVSLCQQSIVGASGCCADGYAANGTYPYAGTTAGTSSGTAYVQFLPCTKN